MSENFRDDWKTHMKNVQWFNIKSLINDGLTFDERLDKVISDCSDEQLRAILINAKEW